MIVIDRLTYSIGREGMVIFRDGKGEDIFIKLDAHEKLTLAQHAAHAATTDLAEISREARVRQHHGVVQTTPFPPAKHSPLEWDSAYYNPGDIDA